MGADCEACACNHSSGWSVSGGPGKGGHPTANYLLSSYFLLIACSIRRASQQWVVRSLWSVLGALLPTSYCLLGSLWASAGGSTSYRLLPTHCLSGSRVTLHSS